MRWANRTGDRAPPARLLPFKPRARRASPMDLKIMTKKKTFARLAFAAPFALALAACNGSGDDAAGGSGEVPQGDPVAEVAAPQGQEWTQVVTQTEQGGWLMGNPDAPIKLVEYGSLTCPACATFSTNGVQPLEEDYVKSGRVSFEFRSMLLHGTADLVLTELVSCGPVETVHPLANQVWANLPQIQQDIQANGAQLEQAMSLAEDQRLPAFAEAAGLLDFFAARGISKEQGRSCLADLDSMRSYAETSANAAEEDAVDRTPTFFVNGRKLDASNWAQLEPILQRAGAR